MSRRDPTRQASNEIILHHLEMVSSSRYTVRQRAEHALVAADALEERGLARWSGKRLAAKAREVLRHLTAAKWAGGSEEEVMEGLRDLAQAAIRAVRRGARLPRGPRSRPDNLLFTLKPWRGLTLIAYQLPGESRQGRTSMTVEVLQQREALSRFGRPRTYVYSGSPAVIFPRGQLWGSVAAHHSIDGNVAKDHAMFLVVYAGEADEDDVANRLTRTQQEWWEANYEDLDTLRMDRYGVDR